MVYNPTLWKDRQVERPNTFSVQNNPDGTITLIPKPGTITEQGTPANANNLNKLENGIKELDEELANIVHNVKSFGVKIDGATDDYTAITNAIAYVKSKGGGTLLFPYTGQKCMVSNELLIDFSNITLDIRCDIQLTKTTKSNLFRFIAPSIDNPLKNIKMLGKGNVIDGNGSNMTGYTYDLGDNLYNTLYAWRVENLIIDNIIFKNGLIGNMTLANCKDYKVSRCKFIDSVHDNGYQSVGSPVPIANYDANDITTWCNGIIKDCEAYGNIDFGFTSYQSPGLIFENCVSRVNGNYATSYGRGGGYSAEVGSLTPRQNMNVKFINCRAYSNIGYGFYVDADGVEIVNCEGIDTKHTGETDSITKYGNGITAMSVRNNLRISGIFSKNAKHGIRILSQPDDANAINNVYINAVCKENLSSGLQMQGINNCDIRGEFSNNSLYGVRVENITNYNYQKGKAFFKKLIVENNNNAGIVVNGFEQCFLEDVYTKENCVTTNNINIATNYCLFFCANNIRTFKGTSTLITLGMQISAGTQKSICFDIISDLSESTRVLDQAVTREGKSYNVNKLLGTDTLATTISKINTIIDRLRLSRIINDGEV